MPDDLSLARQQREERRATALLELFAAVLNTPLERRELTPDQLLAREIRLRERARARSRARRSSLDAGPRGIIGV